MLKINVFWRLNLLPFVCYDIQFMLFSQPGAKLFQKKKNLSYKLNKNHKCEVCTQWNLLSKFGYSCNFVYSYTFLR